MKDHTVEMPKLWRITRVGVIVLMAEEQLPLLEEINQAAARSNDLSTEAAMLSEDLANEIVSLLG